MAREEPIEWRAEALDTIASVLPMNRRDLLAELLMDQDVETLRHLVNEGMGENTLLALTSDLAYLEAWAMAATDSPLPWPAPEALLLKFVAHHLWRPQQREIDPDHGMPTGVENELRQQGFLRVSGPHAPATVRRRLEGAFTSPAVKSAIRLAVRALNRPRARKSVDALTRWLKAARIDKGSVFRKIDRWGNVSTRALEPSAVNAIVKRRAQMAGLDPAEFSAHVLRSGYLTEAANRGIPLPEAMEQSRHRSVQQASNYYNNAKRRSGRASRLL